MSGGRGGPVALSMGNNQVSTVFIFSTFSVKIFNSSI